MLRLSLVIRKVFTVATIISPKESIVSLLLPQFSHLRLVFFLLSFQLVIGIPQDVLGEKVATEKWNISADKVVRYENPNSIVAQGNVVLEKNEKVAPTPRIATNTTSWAELLEEQVKPPVVRADQVEKINTPQYRTTVTIKSDWMVYDVELESIKAKGNVQINTSEEQLFAKEVTLNLSKETGKFTDATILRNELSLHLEGKTIEKTGFDTYRIDDGWIITCKLEDGQTPPWSFSSAKTEIRQGGYAVLTHARFNIKNVPIFYSPYMILPAKNTRQSGFLYPYFSTSKVSGIGLNLPFFLNISDSADVTFFPEFYFDRGFMPGAEFRYVSSTTDKGMFTASFLDDQLSDPSQTEYYSDTNYTHDNSDRYWLRGKADYTLGDGWQSRLDLDIVSDQDYLSEFNSGVTGFRKTYANYIQAFGRGFQNQTDYNRQNSLKTLRSLKGMSFEANLLAINEANTNASDSYTPLWKLPGVGFSGTLPLWETKNYFIWNTSYVNYWRKDGTGGHRVDLKPGISAPIPVSPYLETLAQVTLRETFYYIQTYGDAEWEKDDVQNRVLPEYKIEVATTLERDFLTGEGKLDGFTHQVRPFIKYDHVPGLDQTRYPQWDDVDLINVRNGITYGMDNFLNALSSEGDKKGTVWDAATLRVEQAWDLRKDPSDEPLSAIFSKLGWAPFPTARITYKNSYDIYDSAFTSHTFGGVYQNSRGDQFGLDYSFKDKSYRELNDFNSFGLLEDIKQINANFRSPLPFISSWVAGGKIEHSLSQDETINANGSLTYMANCWSLTFETQYTPVDTSFVVLFNLANIGAPFGVSLLN
ncbi:MAG: LPS assembly protein LptD [Proteobacteria bacterium]|nr:LPS assembly protein LptD [Pseudomonadota bacterium]